MEANAIADTLIEKFGSKWYFLTPDYVYGHALQAAFERKLRDHGGIWTASILPLGTVDYSRALNDAGSFRPQVLDRSDGRRRSNEQPAADRALRTDDDMAVGGALFELESILTSPMPRGSAGGRWNGGGTSRSFPQVKASTTPSAAAPAKRPAHATGSAMRRSACWRRSQTRRNRSTRSSSPARCRDYTLPPISRSIPTASFFRDRDHELMSTVLVGEVHPPRADPFDVFTAQAACKASRRAGPLEASACQLAFPS